MSSIKKIAVVGTGTIGSSWMTLFLAKGYHVVVSDPAPNAEGNLKNFIESEWPRMQEIGLAENADPSHFEFVEDITKHLGDVDFVQENAPERADFKTKLIGDLSKHLPSHTIIASSSSGIPSSHFISRATNPERILIGHPFNPPHLIPLVEVVPHPGTSQDVIDRTIAFYRSLGKTPVLIKKEVPGFLANRIQAAVLAEAYSLVSRGIASPEDVDTAVRMGPGLRWAFAGPFVTSVLGGGSGGGDGSGKEAFGHFMDHLGPAVKGWKEDMDANSFGFGEEEVRRLKEDVSSYAEGMDVEGERRGLAEGVVELLRGQGKGGIS